MFDNMLANACSRARSVKILAGSCYMYAFSWIRLKVIVQVPQYCNLMNEALLNTCTPNRHLLKNWSGRGLQYRDSIEAIHVLQYVVWLEAYTTLIFVCLKHLIELHVVLTFSTHL